MELKKYRNGAVILTMSLRFVLNFVVKATFCLSRSRTFFSFHELGAVNVFICLTLFDVGSLGAKMAFLYSRHEKTSASTVF